MPLNHHQKIGVRLPKWNDNRSGFIMIEVLVGIIIMTLFIGIAMQFMVFGSLLKSRAQQYSEAMNWIQQDLEEIKYQATKYKSNSLSASATVTSSSVSLSSAQYFEINDKLKIGSDTTVYTISNISGNNLTISPNLTVNSPVNSSVIVTEGIRCNRTATPATITTGYADGFRDRIVGSDLSVTSSNVDTTKTSNRSGRQFRLRKNISLANIAPYNVVQISYNISEIYSGSAFGIPVADIYAEVVPPPSFACSE